MWVKFIWMIAKRSEQTLKSKQTKIGISMETCDQECKRKVGFLSVSSEKSVYFSVDHHDLEDSGCGNNSECKYHRSWDGNASVASTWCGAGGPTWCVTVASICRATGRYETSTTYYGIGLSTGASCCRWTSHIWYTASYHHCIFLQWMIQKQINLLIQIQQNLFVLTVHE